MRTSRQPPPDGAHEGELSQQQNESGHGKPLDQFLPRLLLLLLECRFLELIDLPINTWSPA
jgi:hypothetical protein